MRLILAVLYTAGSAAITWINNELPGGQYAVVAHSPDDPSVQEQMAEPMGTIQLYAGQPTLLALVLYAGYNFTYEYGMLAAGLSSQIAGRDWDNRQIGGSAGCATHLKEGNENLFTEWTPGTFEPLFQFQGSSASPASTLQAVQGYIMAPMAGLYTLCYSADGTFNSDAASWANIKLNVSGMYKDCGHKDCLEETNVLNCSMSREFDELHTCVEEVLDADYMGGLNPAGQFAEGGPQRVLDPGYSLETGLRYGFDAPVSGCPRTSGDKTFANVYMNVTELPQTIQEITRGDPIITETHITFRLNETWRTPDGNPAPYAAKSIRLCSCPGSLRGDPGHERGRDGCQDPADFTQPAGTVRVYGTAVCSDGDCALPYSGMMTGLPFLLDVACPPGACNYDVRSRLKMVNTFGSSPTDVNAVNIAGDILGCSQAATSAFMIKDCGLPCLEFGGGGMDHKQFPRPAWQNERGNARYVFSAKIISPKYGDVCLCHEECERDENWVRVGRIRVQAPIWVSNTTDYDSTGAQGYYEIVSTANKTGSLALEKTVLGVLGLTGRETLFVTLGAYFEEPTCWDDTAYRTRLYNGTFTSDGNPDVVSFTGGKSDELIYVHTAGLYTICFCGDPTGSDKSGCNDGFLIPLDTMILRGPSRDLSLHVTTDAHFYIEYNAFGAVNGDYIHLQPKGQRCEDIDVTDRNDENPVVKTGVRSNCPGDVTMSSCEMARSLSVKLLTANSAAPQPTKRRPRGTVVYVTHIERIPPPPGSKELIAHLVFDGDPGLDDGDVLVLGETIVPTTETSEAFGLRARVRGQQTLPTGGTIRRGTPVRATGDVRRWAIEGWADGLLVELYVNETRVETPVLESGFTVVNGQKIYNIVNVTFEKRGEWWRLSRAMTRKPLWATEVEEVQVCWSDDARIYRSYVGAITITRPKPAGLLEAVLLENMAQADGSLIIRFITGGYNYASVTGRTSLRIRLRDKNSLKLMRGGLREADREAVHPKAEVYDGEENHVVCADIFQEIWSTDAVLTPMGCRYTRTQDDMRDVILQFQPRDGLTPDSEYFFVLSVKAIGGDSRVDVLTMDDLDLRPYVALEIANTTVEGPRPRWAMRFDQVVTEGMTVVETPWLKRRTESTFSLRVTMNDNRPLLVNTVLRLIVRPLTQWDLMGPGENNYENCEFNTTINKTTHARTYCNVTDLPILGTAPFFDVSVVKPNATWRYQSPHYPNNFVHMPKDFNISFGFSLPLAGFFPTPFQFSVMNISDGSTADTVQTSLVSSPLPEPLSLAQIVVKAGPSNLNQAPFVGIQDFIVVKLTMRAPMRSWKDDRGRIGTATVKFTLGVGLSCVAAEETDQGMAILLFENPEGRGRLTEGNWTFNGRYCEYTMHENGTIYYGESRWVKLSVQHPPYPQAVSVDGSTWKLATSSQSPPTIIPYVSRENVSCGGVFNTTANPMSNATALSYANENITYCYADVARERKEFENVTFFNDFTPNITAGLAARIATLSIIEKAVVQQTDATARAQWVRIFFMGAIDTTKDAEVAIAAPLLFVFEERCTMRDLEPHYYWNYGLDAPKLERLKDMGPCRAEMIEREEGYPAAMNRARATVAEVLAGTYYGFELYMGSANGAWSTGFRLSVLSEQEEVAATMHPVGISYNAAPYANDDDLPIHEKSFGLYNSEIPGTMVYEPKTYAMTRVGMRIKFDQLVFPTPAGTLTSLRLTAPYGFQWEDPSNDYFDPLGSRATRRFPSVPQLVQRHPNQLVWPALGLDEDELYGFTVYAVMPFSTPNLASNSMTLELGYLEYEAKERYAARVWEGKTLKILYEPLVWMHTPIRNEQTYVTFQLGVYTLIGVNEGIIIKGEEDTEYVDLQCPQRRTVDQDIDYIGRRNAFRGGDKEDVLVIKHLPLVYCESKMDEDTLRPKVTLMVTDEIIVPGMYEWDLPIKAPVPFKRLKWSIGTNKEVMSALPPVIDQKIWIDGFDVFRQIGDAFFVNVFNSEVIKSVGIDNRPTMQTHILFSLSPAKGQTLFDYLAIRGPRGYIFAPDCLPDLVMDIFKVFGSYNNWDDYFTEWPRTRQPTKCVGDYNYANATLAQKGKLLKSGTPYIFRIGARNPEYTPKGNTFTLILGDSASPPLPGYDLWMFHNVSLTSVTGMRRLPGDETPNYVTVTFEPTNLITSAPDRFGGGIILNAPNGFEFTLEANLTEVETETGFIFEASLESKNVLILTLLNTTAEVQEIRPGKSYSLFASVYNPYKMIPTRDWYVESFMMTGADKILVDEEGNPYTRRFFTPIRDNLADFNWLPGFPIVEALNWTIVNGGPFSDATGPIRSWDGFPSDGEDIRGRAPVTVRLEVVEITAQGATHATVQLPRGALYTNCPSPDQPLPEEGETQQLTKGESVPLACGCRGTDCQALFELRPIKDGHMILHLFTLNAPYVHDESQNFFRIEVGFLPIATFLGAGLGDGFVDVFARAKVSDPLAAARKESWRIIPRLLEIIVFPRHPEVDEPPRPAPGADPEPPDPRTRRGGTAAGSVCTFEVSFVPVHDAQYFTFETLLPDEGVDFSMATCIQGCEAIIPAAGSGNRTDVNSSFSTFIEMFENVRVEMLFADVVLGQNGGPGRFTLKTYSYQEESSSWIPEDESTEDVGYYPGNLGAREMIGFYRDEIEDTNLDNYAKPGPVLWTLRNEWYGKEGESPVLQALPPRRSELFTLEAVVLPTQPANHLEVTCVDAFTEQPEVLTHPVGSDGPVSIDRLAWGLSGKAGHMGVVAWNGLADRRENEEYYLRVPMRRDENCVLYVQTYVYDDKLYGPGGRAMTGTNDGFPVMRLSDPIETSISSFRAPPLSRIRAYFSVKAVEGENATLVAPPGFTFPDDACVEIEEQVCLHVPSPCVPPACTEENRPNNSALFFLTPGELVEAVVRVVGPPAPAPDTFKIVPSKVPRPPRVRPPWYVVTDRAERWQELRGLTVPALRALLTVPAIPGAREARCSVEFSLEGVLADPVLSTGGSNPEELRGALLRLMMPVGYEPICDLELDFAGQACDVRGREAIVTLQRRLRRGDYTLSLRANVAEKTPADNVFQFRVETLDGVGVGESTLPGPEILDFVLELPRLKWSIKANPGPVPISISIVAPKAVTVRLLSSILFELPLGFTHRIFEPEDVSAPNIYYDMYDLDVSDPRRIKLMLIKESQLNGLLKVYFEVSVPQELEEGRNVWKVFFLSDFETLASFALPGFQIGAWPSDWVPSRAAAAALFLFAISNS